MRVAGVLTAAAATAFIVASGYLVADKIARSELESAVAKMNSDPTRPAGIPDRASMPSARMAQASLKSG